jgi:branched-chain amino acid transport system substrate-binding protein
VPLAAVIEGAGKRKELRMRRISRRRALRTVMAPGVVVLLAATVAACGGSAATTTGTSLRASVSVSARGGAQSAKATSLKCGLGNGRKAAGRPITLGAIVTNQPGTSFTDIANMAGAYFRCVNDNGGIYGRPIRYDVLEEQTNPGQVAADAKQLIDSDHVVGIVGSSSIIDCAVNGKTYRSSGLALIDAGIASQCYGSSWSAPVNMGPRFSGDGAAQTAILRGAKKIVIDQSNVPGTGYNAGGIVDIARAHHIPVVQLTANASSLNGETVAEQIVQAAGAHGAADLIFTPPVAQEILQGAQKLGLENRILWTCATPCNTDSLAKSLGSAWNHKLFVNAEMNDVHDDRGADAKLYLKVFHRYGSNVSGGVGSFSQFGFTIGQLAVRALLSIKSHDYTVRAVNAAFHALKGFHTDFLCKPWYYGYNSVHLPNNTDYTVWPENGQMQRVPGSGCLPISTADPEVAHVRAYERRHHV